MSASLLFVGGLGLLTWLSVANIDRDSRWVPKPVSCLAGLLLFGICTALVAPDMAQMLTVFNYALVEVR